MSSGPEPWLEQLGVLETLIRKPSPPTLVLTCIFARSDPTSELGKLKELSPELESTDALPRAILEVYSSVAPKGRALRMKSLPPACSCSKVFKELN